MSATTFHTQHPITTRGGAVIPACSEILVEAPDGLTAEAAAHAIRTGLATTESPTPEAPQGESSRGGAESED